MADYQLEIKQIVDYPRCRIYREFIQTLLADRSIRTNNGCSGLFYFTVLCSFANFRTSYRRIDGISYTVYPGEWVCPISEMAEWFRLRTKRQVLNVLSAMQEDHLIEFTVLGRDKLVKYKIKGWRRHNTVLDYNCPCQKDTVFIVRAADGHSVDEIRTGTDGRAELKNLLPGVYEISEKSVPSPYLLDAPSQLMTLYPNRDHTVYFENHQKPSLTVNKICSVTGEPLEGAKFQVVYASSDTESGEINDLGYFYSDANGQFKLSNLKDGWYEITEVESVPGYRIKDPATQEVFIKAGESKTVTFENTPLSALVVYKFDSVTGEAVSNAVFQVKYLTGTSGTGGTVIGTYKTSANGSFTVTGLDEGTYIVEELASDSGHVIDTAPQTAYISGKDQDVVELYFGNSPKGALLIKKIDSVSREPLSDVEFFVTTSDGTVVGNANGKFVTDSAGTILIENIDPGTTLVVKEIRAKDDTYILDDTPQTAEIKAGQTVTLEFRNQRKGNLIIYKQDSVSKTPLEGVRFKITYADGRVVDAEGGQLSSNGLYWTDSDGMIKISGITGTLVVTEEETIPGYTIHEETRSKTVVVNTNDTQSLYFYNDPVGGVEIIKVNADKKTERIPNVTFEIRRADDGLVDTVTTDKNGRAFLSLEDGHYYAVEIENADGFELDNTPHYFEVKDGKTTTLTVENKSLGRSERLADQDRERSGLEQAASTAHTVRSAIKSGKALAGAAKGASVGGPYGAVAGALWESRGKIGKIIAAIAVLLMLPILYILMLPSLIFGGLTDSGAAASTQPILNDNAAIVQNVNDIAFTINQVLGEGIDDVKTRIAQDFATLTDAYSYEIINPYEANMVSNTNSFLGQYCAARGEDWENISLTDLEQTLRQGKSQLYAYSRTAEQRMVDDDDPDTPDIVEQKQVTVYIYTIIYNGEGYFADSIFHLSDEQKELADDYAQNLSVFLGDGLFQGISNVNSIPSLGDITFTDGATEVVYFNQLDERYAAEPYGTDHIGGYGCGPTAMSIVVSSLTSDTVDPIEMAEWAYENGYWCSKSGSYHSLIPGAAEAWGLSVEGCAASEPQRIVDALSEGKLVVAIMTKGHFTSSGHFIVLRGVQDGKFLVADPASYTRSQKLWDLSIIVGEASNRAGAGGPFWIIGT